MYYSYIIIFFTLLSTCSFAQENAGMTERNILDGLKVIVDGAQTLNGWNLLIIATSIAAIVSTSYFRPMKKKVRLIYLLFIPGWFFIALSIHYSDLITRSYMSAVMPSNESLRNIFRNINNEYIFQIKYFQIGLLFFAGWLLFYLLWWIFDNSNSKGKEI